MAELRAIAKNQLPPGGRQFNWNGEDHYLVIAADVSATLVDQLASYAFQEHARVDQIVGEHDLTSERVVVETPVGNLAFAMPNPANFVHGDMIQVLSVIELGKDLIYLAFAPDELAGILRGETKPELE